MGISGDLHPGNFSAFERLFGGSVICIYAPNYKYSASNRICICECRPAQKAPERKNKWPERDSSSLVVDLAVGEEQLQTKTGSRHYQIVPGFRRRTLAQRLLVYPVAQLRQKLRQWSMTTGKCNVSQMRREGVGIMRLNNLDPTTHVELLITYITLSILSHSTCSGRFPSVLSCSLLHALPFALISLNL